VTPVDVRREIAVSLSVAVALTLGIAPPLGSVAVPKIVTLPCAESMQADSKNTQARVAIRHIVWRQDIGLYSSSSI
jgi:hypothetical protein